MKSIGMYPGVHTDTGGAGVVSQAGAVALVETIRVAGLDVALSKALSRWRKPAARHDPAKVITDLAVTLALGGDCLADVALLRAEPSVFGVVASDPTVSRTIDALASDPKRALAAIDSARAQARAAVWAAAGENAPDHGASADAPVVIDLAAPTYKRGFGFHPLWSFLDHGAQGTGEPLSVLLRKGNAGSNTAADHISVVRAALAQLPGLRPGTRAGRKVLIRTDGAGATHAFLDWLTGQRLSYSVGFALPTDFAATVNKMPTAGWTPAYDADGQPRDGAWVADVVRHEAPWIRVEVKDLHRLVVAAAGLELGAA